MTLTYQAWPEPHLWNWSFQLTRLLGIIDFGGSDFTEIHEVVQRIKPGDDESWHQEWYRMGRLCEELAREAERFGNRLTARYGYQRASNYYRVPVLPDQERCAEDPDTPQGPGHIPGRGQTL